MSRNCFIPDWFPKHDPCRIESMEDIEFTYCNFFPENPVFFLRACPFYLPRSFESSDRKSLDRKLNNTVSGDAGLCSRCRRSLDGNMEEKLLQIPLDEIVRLWKTGATKVDSRRRYTPEWKEFFPEDVPE